MDKNISELQNGEFGSIKEAIQKYFSFWPFYLISIFICLICAIIFLRYAEYKYESVSVMQIIDKSQDSEMALPTAMTIFNRSMINLDNEIGVLNSYRIHEKVVQKLNSNVMYYTKGSIKSFEDNFNDWFADFELDLHIDPNEIEYKSTFNISLLEGKLSVQHFDHNDNLVYSIDFPELSTKNSSHKLPFDLKINKYNQNELDKFIVFTPKDFTVKSFMKKVVVTKNGNESDQLKISIKHPNKKIGDLYLNTLMSEFDKDGIIDRQQEYKSTVDFVDSRSEILLKELEKIELRKQSFKEINNLSDIQSFSSANTEQKLNYDNELFKAKSQKDLIDYLKQSIESDKYKLMPLNIGIEDTDINSLITQFNEIVKERNRYLISFGKNNPYLKNLERNIDDFTKNIISSINNYSVTLDISIKNLEKKEGEFEQMYFNIPKNEKILRSIQRELEVKESLFLLLLQKREEAAINFAVVKPSIKIIDFARGENQSVSPNKIVIYFFSLIVSLILPTFILFLIFFFDNKIHLRKQIEQNIDLPIIAEIPHINSKEDLKISDAKYSRNLISESIRMLIGNLNFILFGKEFRKKRNNIILVTSSIKGEGKTLVSTNFAISLTSKFKKILLIGSDLRNPQIHKLLNLPKETKGLTNFIHQGESYKKYVINYNGLDILLSGVIPPNPTQILSSNEYEKFIEKVSSDYDYVVIDSAPCLLVSDTFEISKLADTTLYVIRANHSKTELFDFINNCKENSKINNINIVFNGVGNSKSYGYKYAYQYGYKYMYKYNYGYSYGYSGNK